MVCVTGEGTITLVDHTTITLVDHTTGATLLLTTQAHFRTKTDDFMLKVTILD